MDEKSPAQERRPSSLRVETKTSRSRFSAQKKKGVPAVPLSSSQR